VVVFKICCCALWDRERGMYLLFHQNGCGHINQDQDSVSLWCLVSNLGKKFGCSRSIAPLVLDENGEGCCIEVK
jgi:hypothetical protein